MSDSLTLLRHNLNMLPQLQRDDQIKVRDACKRKMHDVKGKRSIQTLADAIRALDDLLGDRS